MTPLTSEDYQPPLAWDLLQGRPQPFSLCWRGALAFITRKAWVERGGLLTAASWSVAARAGLIIMSLGLVIAYVDVPAFTIWAYYGAMFLLAVPLSPSFPVSADRSGHHRGLDLLAEGLPGPA